MKNNIRTVKGIYQGRRVVDGAGVRIHRIIGSDELEHIDPFVLLDEIRSTKAEDYVAGFPTHPHRGIETITYMVHGSFEHRDSRGGGGLLSDGCVQWMTAGRGILHSEMPGKTEGELWGYQLWLSLPAKDKMAEARYQHLPPENIPVVRKEGMEVRIISGAFDGTEGPASNYAQTDYFDVRLKPGAVFRLALDRNMNSFCYAHTDSAEVGPAGSAETVRAGELAEFGDGDVVEVRAGTEGAGFLFLAAYPNNEPIVRGGPFVMNTEEEIRQAFADYQSGVLR
jgi:redox-sensitive bicupin YhaK (pirin superfamily)